MAISLPSVVGFSKGLKFRAEFLWSQGYILGAKNALSSFCYSIVLHILETIISDHRTV